MSSCSLSLLQRSRRVLSFRSSPDSCADLNTFRRFKQRPRMHCGCYFCPAQTRRESLLGGPYGGPPTRSSVRSVRDGVSLSSRLPAGHNRTRTETRSRLVFCLVATQITILHKTRQRIRNSVTRHTNSKVIYLYSTLISIVLNSFQVPNQSFVYLKLQASRLQGGATR